MKYEQLLALGGEVVGGIMFIGRKEVGRWNGGEFYAEPGIEDIVAKAKTNKEQELAAQRDADQVAKDAAKEADKIKPAAHVTGDARNASDGTTKGGAKVAETAAHLSATAASTSMNDAPSKVGEKGTGKLDSEVIEGGVRKA